MNADTIDRLGRSLSQATSRRQAFKLAGGAVVGGLLATKLTSASAQQGLGGLTTTVEGLLPDGTPFSGTLAVTNFFDQGGVLAVAGTILDAAGDVLSGFTALVTDAQGSCEILSLTLGPLELDLLGLVIEIPNPVVLTITAERGPGNLLGNLLCGIAGLLDSNAATTALVRALNRLLGLLD